MTTAANLFKLKRSDVAGLAPQTTELALGELALNVHDGKLFFKKTVSGTESIVTLDPTKIVNNGYSVSINVDGSIAFPGYVFPVEPGTSGQVLKYPANGNVLEWGTAGTGGGGADINNFPIEGGEPYSVYSLVDTVFDGGAP